jgi:hypothetical protein
MVHDVYEVEVVVVKGNVGVETVAVPSWMGEWTS